MNVIAASTTWKHKRSLLLVIFIIAALALIPFYGILFPPLPDLPHHLLVNKLFWEELVGVSKLDLEISWYFGYRLSAFVMIAAISVFRLLGVSLTYLPKGVAILLIVIHAVVVIPFLFNALRSREWKTVGLSACFALPVVVAMYSACWFMGFVGYTLAITMLVPAVFFTEKFLTTGAFKQAAFIFITLVLVYTAHPFALAFWILWILSRFVISIPVWTIPVEWKRFLVLGVLIVPVFLYHYLATASNELAISAKAIGAESPIVTAEYWHKFRFQGMYNGDYLKADEIAAPASFTYLSIMLIVVSTGLAFLSSQRREIRPLVISSLFFLFISSWINEKFLPIPGGHWLAYDYRFSSTIYVICSAVAAWAIIRSLPEGNGRRLQTAFFVVIAVLSVFFSMEHIYEVQKAYARFDIPARAFMEKVFDRERPLGITLPRSKWWYPESRFLRHYACLQEPDCNPAGTLFSNLGGIIYPVTVKSRKRIFPDKPYAMNRKGEPGNAINGGEGYAGGQFSGPLGIATDNAGNLYVADTGNSRIQKFDADGNFIFDFGTFGDGFGEFKTPTGVAVDADGNIYVTEPATLRLMRFKPDGQFEKEWKGNEGGFHWPRDIAVGSNNKIYVADQNRIVMFDPVTEKTTNWGSFGSEKGKFNKLLGIATGGNLVFATDADNNRIQVFDLDGNFVSMWDVEAWARYGWHYPDCAFDESADRLYVTSGWSREVVVFDSKGSLIEKFKAHENTELNNPSAIALSKTNNRIRLYVLSTGSDIIDHGEPGVSLFELR